MNELRIRPSSIGTFLDCSVKFNFNSIEKLQVPKALALAFGIAIHKPLEVNYRQKITTKQDITTEQMVDEFDKAFETETETVEQEQYQEESKGTVKDIGVRLIKQYHALHSLKIQPTIVEQRLEAEIEGLDNDVTIILTGQLDLVDNQKRLIDHKTTKRAPSEVSQSYVLQQTSYRLLAEVHGIEIAQNNIDYLIKTTLPKIQRFRVETDPDFLNNILAVLINSVKNDVYVPNRNSMLCSRRYCSYWRECERRFGGRVKE